MIDLTAVEKFDLCKNVTVYKNAYPRHEELVSAYQDSPGGAVDYTEYETQSQYSLSAEVPYYNFGKMRHAHYENVDYVNGTYKGQSPDPSDTAFPLISELMETYDNCLEDFQSRHNFRLSIDSKTGLQVRYYEPETSCGWHSDCQVYRSADDHNPFDKDINTSNYSVTLNCYLNNGYEGGELMFKLSGGPDGEEFTEGYQPEAGDIILFPSAFPYMHSITNISKDKRYFANYMVIEENEPVWQFSLNSESTEVRHYKDQDQNTEGVTRWI